MSDLPDILGGLLLIFTVAAVAAAGVMIVFAWHPYSTAFFAGVLVTLTVLVIGEKFRLWG